MAHNCTCTYVSIARCEEKDMCMFAKPEQRLSCALRQHARHSENVEVTLSWQRCRWRYPPSSPFDRRGGVRRDGTYEIRAAAPRRGRPPTTSTYTQHIPPSTAPSTPSSSIPSAPPPSPPPPHSTSCHNDDHDCVFSVSASSLLTVVNSLGSGIGGAVSSSPRVARRLKMMRRRTAASSSLLALDSPTRSTRSARTALPSCGVPGGEAQLPARAWSSRARR